MDDLLPHITQAVREADAHFERVGGSSRHWVRDCFLPMLEKHGLEVVCSTCKGDGWVYTNPYKARGPCPKCVSREGSGIEN